MRAKVGAIAQVMQQMDNVDLPLVHHFSPGVYAREMHIPAGCVVVGKIHKFPQLNILSAGEMQVLTENGIEHVQAPFTVVSPAGTQRIAYSLTPCVWTTILATEETDVEKIEAHFTVSTEAEYLAFCEQQKQIGPE
jgi:hypothetical protein